MVLLFYVFQVHQNNTQLQIQVQLLEQELGVVKLKNAANRNEEDATLNAMHNEIKRLIEEK